MNKILRILLKYWYLLVILILFYLLYYYVNDNKKSKIEIERLKTNIEVIQADFQTYKIKVKEIINGKDSIISRNAAQIMSLNLTLDEYKQFRQQDITEITNLKLKLKNIQSGFAVNFETDFNIITKLIDNSFTYTTEYYNFDGKIIGDTLIVNGKTKDGLRGYITKVPKVRFLWWSWGVKGKQLNIVLQNPNSKITYMKYIVIDN